MERHLAGAIRRDAQDDHLVGGAGDLGASDLERPGTVFQIGVPANRIDMPVIGKRQLVQNKRASGRPQDLPDLVLESD